MDNNSFSIERVNYLLTLNLSQKNLAKRMYRAKAAYFEAEEGTLTKSNMKREYLGLSLIKAMNNLKDV